jgi:hypothetical protein
MALDIVSLDIVSFDSFDALITSVIFIRVFIDLTPYRLNLTDAYAYAYADA